MKITTQLSGHCGGLVADCGNQVISCGMGSGHVIIAVPISQSPQEADEAWYCMVTMHPAQWVTPQYI